MIDIDYTQVDHFIEIRGIYDGWSIAVMADGRHVNRWDPETYPGRYKAAQDFIDMLLGAREEDLERYRAS